MNQISMTKNVTTNVDHRFRGRDNKRSNLGWRARFGAGGGATFLAEARSAITLALAMGDGESAVPEERRDCDDRGRTDLTPVKSKRPVRAGSKADGTGIADDDELLTADDN